MKHNFSQLKQIVLCKAAKNNFSAKNMEKVKQGDVDSTVDISLETIDQYKKLKDRIPEKKLDKAAKARLYQIGKKYGMKSPEAKKLAKEDLKYLKSIED